MQAKILLPGCLREVSVRNISKDYDLRNLYIRDLYIEDKLGAKVID